MERGGSGGGVLVDGAAMSDFLKDDFQRGGRRVG
jgi:hypothetical protein